MEQIPLSRHTSSLVLVLTLLAGVGPSRGEDESQYRVRPGARIRLGLGFDPENPGLPLQPVYDDTDASEVWQLEDAQFEGRLMRSMHEVDRQEGADLAVTARAAYAGGSFRASASQRSRESSSLREDSFVYVLSARQVLGNAHLPATKRMLAPATTSLQSESAAFLREYGSHHVDTIVYYASVHAVITLTAKRSSSESELAQTLSAAFDYETPSISLGATLDLNRRAARRELTEGCDITVSLHAEGGMVAALADPAVKLDRAYRVDHASQLEALYHALKACMTWAEKQRSAGKRPSEVGTIHSFHVGTTPGQDPTRLSRARIKDRKIASYFECYEKAFGRWAEVHRLLEAFHAYGWPAEVGRRREALAAEVEALERYMGWLDEQTGLCLGDPEGNGGALPTYPYWRNGHGERQDLPGPTPIDLRPTDLLGWFAAARVLRVYGPGTRGTLSAIERAVGINDVTEVCRAAEREDTFRLDLPPDATADLRPLATLTAMESLTLRGGCVRDVRPLAQLPRLKRLEVIDPRCSSPLTAPTFARTVWEGPAQISDIHRLGLQKLGNVEELVLDSTVEGWWDRLQELDLRDCTNLRRAELTWTLPRRIQIPRRPRGRIVTPRVLTNLPRVTAGWLACVRGVDTRGGRAGPSAQHITTLAVEGGPASPDAWTEKGDVDQELPPLMLPKADVRNGVARLELMGQSRFFREDPKDLSDERDIVIWVRLRMTLGNE